MAAMVKVPALLRKVTDGKELVECEGKTVADVLESLEAAYPGIRDRLCDGNGEIRRFINIYVNQEDIRFMDGTGTSVNDGDEILIVPAIAGGR
ncbi:MAG: MoaD/ThiS family protein [Firmicutes bacterium]|nr:MoaD/ThiS family protein [Bacillota bacterium]